MIPILKLVLALATVLGVVVRGQNWICNGYFEKNQLQNAAQQALQAIGSTRTPTASNKLANRGQHVFNNNLLKFHRSVLQDLLKDVGGYEELNNLIEGLMPLSQTQQNAISTTMVVHFSSNNEYVDYNAVVYGEYVGMLREALVAYLKACTSNNQGDKYKIQEKRSQVEFIANEMVNRNVFVDPMACDRWLKENQNGVQQFNDIRAALKNMIQNILKDFKEVSKKIKGFREKNNCNS
ncbi:uncharacterized protein LOC127519991 isoform X2 [Ctenopharyngodon idella]|uniref:uncharacterized protein LOC127519991 isoform X2 n=1 Tax=Ctenopharyngodon idella TaxID=7959 RepID=UPI002232A01A|nr:uncharacterized protein LOC127519991 isoform X2 [Ctenopharyngodon idella]